MAFSKKVRLIIYQKYNCHCGYCGRFIEYKDMQIDHIKPVQHKGSNELENLMPSCRGCNHYKRDYTLEGFRKLMKTLHQRIEAHYINKVALNFGVITEIKPFDGKFYFEKQND